MVEIGANLREARERRQLSYADVEEATLIPARYVEALESEAFGRLPEGLYRRSFLREYADFLGLDGKAYVAELELHETPMLGPAPVVPASTVVRRRQLPSLTNAAVVVGALLLVGVAAWKLASGNGKHPPRATPPPATTTSPATPPTTTAPPRPAAITTRTTPPTPKPAATLVISAARGDCWLSVQIDSSGKTVYEQTLAQGGTVRFGLKQPLLIRFGAPSNVTATIGGRDVTGSLTSTATGLVASASGLRAAA